MDTRTRLLAAILLLLPRLAGAVDAPHTGSDIAGLRFLTRYEAGGETAAEIVAWNGASRTAFVINGRDRTVDLVSLSDIASGTILKAKTKLNLVQAAAAVGVVFGDVTSVAVSPDQSLAAVAVQDADYTRAGCVLFLDKEGKLRYALKAGVQPDMLAFTPDGTTLLVANEGEARGGYADDIVDPAGSVSIFAIEAAGPALKAEIGFGGLDAATLRAAGVIVQSRRGADGKILSLLDPAVDLEPEYIAVSADSASAWVSLQEANAIAKIDLGDSRLEWVKALPLKDYFAAGNELDLRSDKKAELRQEPLFGLLMPDAIGVFSAAGRTFLVTANEGDGREWPILPNGEADEESPGFYKNEIKAGKIKEGLIAPSMPQDQKNFLALAREKDSPYASVVLHAEKSRNDAGFYEKLHIFGGRSFSVLDAETLELVYDSGSLFERLAAERYPASFNASNDNAKLDSRSPKKGPEPEGVEVARQGDRTFVFVGLERQGGVAVFDASDPSSIRFVSYANSRDFSAAVAGDSGPEGIEWVSADLSPTGKALLLAANETSGTLAVFEAVGK